MKIVEFQGYKCIEKPVEDWDGSACKHLKKFVSQPNEDRPTSILRILQNGARSADVFIIVKGPLPKIEIPEGSALSQNERAISCGQCWVDVYDAKKL